MGKIRNDGWKNILVGLGSKKDKQKRTEIDSPYMLKEQDLDLLYMDGLTARIVDIVPDDMTREGLDLSVSSTDEEEVSSAKTAYAEALEELDAYSIVNQALKWKRLYGGCFIFMAAIDGSEWNKPLKPENVKELKFRIIPKYDVEFEGSTYNSDEKSPYFGELEIVKIRIRKLTGYIVKEVHISRLVPFFGKTVSPSMESVGGITYADKYFGLSEVMGMYEAIRDYNGATASSINLVYELVIGKYKFDGLLQALSSGQEKIIQERVELIDMMKSCLNAVVMDKNDDFVRDSISLAGLDSVLNNAMLLLSAVTSIPLTRLFGMSPSGLSSTGEGDQKNYYDMIKSGQSNTLKPAFSQIFTVIQGWKKIKVMVPIVFAPLFQLTEKEQADVNKLNQETSASKASMYKTYTDMGVLGSEEVLELEWQATLDSMNSGA